MQSAVPISFELAGRQHTEVAFCGSDLSTLESIKQMLATDYYHITPTTDICGIETAVAMKNAYAMGVSLAVGLAQRDKDDAPEMYNPQAGLFYQSTKEMSSIIKSAGGGENAVFFRCGRSVRHGVRRQDAQAGHAFWQGIYI